MLHLDHPATFVRCFSGWKKQIEILEPARVGLSDRIDRAVAGGVLQLSDAAAVGVDLDRQRTRERGRDGGHVARTAAPRWLSPALDA